MPRQSLQHVTTWVFDLDNTLYPPQMRLFDQIEQKMTAWLVTHLAMQAAEADRLRQHYWSHYGTTLAGLMHEHGVAPEAFLADVHDIDFSILAPDPELAAAVAALPGRRIVYTNADLPYAAKVLEKRGLSGLFDAIYGVESAEYRPKPERAAYEVIFTKDGLVPEQAAMLEDDPRNLLVPHEMGMRTIHVAPEADGGSHIHHHTSDLAAFLRQLQAG